MDEPINEQQPRDAFLADPSLPAETQMKAREALARYVERQKRKYGDPPPEGYGLDGYPLQRTQNVERRTRNEEAEGGEQ